MSKQQAVIYDLQGTLIDVRGIRKKYLGGPKKYFDNFHQATGGCPPNWDILKRCHQEIQNGKIILPLTGMNEKHRDVAQDWLDTHMVRSPGLWMRPDGDYRKDFVVKRERFEELCQTYDIVHATDDNPQMIELWKSLGIPYTVAPGWEEYPS